MITGKDGAWSVKSEDGSKHLGGPYKTKAEAEKRLKQVEYFKSHPKESSMQKPRFITDEHVKTAIAAIIEEKFLVVDKDGTGHLPVDDARHMGAAWAALHGGYRGQKYEGPDKSKAIAKLKALYKSRGLDTPSEADSTITGGLFFDEALSKNDSYDSLRYKVECAINDNVKLGIDMDLFPGYAVYSMKGCMYQIGYAVDNDGDVHLGEPEEVELQYAPTQQPMHAEESTMSESCDPINESAYDASKGVLTVTVIRPGLSKNNRYYSPELLKKSHKIFEGAKMFADHQTDDEAKARPEGRTKDWVASLTKVWPESDGTIKGSAVVIDPIFKQKLEALNTNGLLPQMGVSIRAVGEAYDGDVQGKKAKIVESLVAARSVDFVTFAGAGGQVEAIQ
jgi:hypothetical protein